MNPDPSRVTRTDRPYTFDKLGDGRYAIHIRLPFATKGSVGLFKKGDELVVGGGSAVGRDPDGAALWLVAAGLQQRTR